LENGYDDAQAGSGVWFGPEDPRNAALKIPGPNQSKQVGQLAAVLHAVQKTPPFAPLHIISNSKYIIDCFFRKLASWEECGWINIPHKEFIRPVYLTYKLEVQLLPLQESQIQQNWKMPTCLLNKAHARCYMIL
jgi:hypothetical protein